MPWLALHPLAVPPAPALQPRPSDPFLTCCVALEVDLRLDWAAAAACGLDVTSTWALVVQAVKASGVILLLGVGSLVCYKLYNYCWPKTRSRFSSPDSSPSSKSHPRVRVTYSCAPGELIEDVEEEDNMDIQGCYFGPLDGKEKLGWTAYNSENDADIDTSKLCQCARHCPVHHRNTLSSKHRHPRLSWKCPSHVTSASQQKPTAWILRKLSDVINISSGHQATLIGNQVPQGSSFSHTKGRNHSMKVKLVNPRKEPMLISFTEDKDFYCQVCHEISLCTEKSCRESITSDIPHIPRDESFDSLGFPKGLPSEGSLDSVCSEPSLDLSLPEISLGASTMGRFEGIQQVINQIKSNCDNMSEDFETIKCNRNLPGMSNLMKANTGSATHELGTASPYNGEEKESTKDQCARACFAGLYSLTVINNSTSSELSDVCLNTENKQGSFGSAESFEWDSPNHIANSEIGNSPIKVAGICKNDSGENICHSNYIKSDLDIDEESVVCDYANNIILNQPAIIKKTLDMVTASEDDLMAHLEWDDDLTEYKEKNDNIQPSNSFMHTLDNLEMDMEAELQVDEDHEKQELLADGTDSIVTSYLSTKSYSEACSTEKCSGMESSGFGSLMLDSSISMVSPISPIDAGQSKQLQLLCNSVESGYVDWDVGLEQPSLHDQQEPCEKSMAFSSSCTSEISTPITDNSDMASPCDEPYKLSSVANIGLKVDLLQYAIKEWQGNTKKAETILKGYAEIPSMLNVHHLRCIRGDNYCGIRAAIFQILSQGLAVPPGYKTLNYLMESARDLIRHWTFANRLQYKESDRLFGVESCLQSLDNMANLLQSHSIYREDQVAQILNSNPLMDLHIMEAVKLHMFKNAVELYRSYTSGEDIPLFAMLMFSRDTSESPEAFMKNHLLDVGNTSGLEQIEMFLLGYALHVTLKVVRPSMYGTEEYICCYPEFNTEGWPEVLLIAEDDRHYNVLVH